MFYKLHDIVGVVLRHALLIQYARIILSPRQEIPVQYIDKRVELRTSTCIELQCKYLY